MATLRVVSGPAAGQTLEVVGEVIIGREGDGLAIPDKEISRRNTAVRPTEGGVEIEDLGSMNGTMVDGRRITEPVTLTMGGTIEVGSSQIRVELTPMATTRVTAAPDVTRVTGKPPPPPPGPPPAETAPGAPAAPEPALELTAAGFSQGRPFGRAGALIDRSVREPNLPGGPAVPLTLRL